MQIAAGELHLYRAVAQARQHRGHQRRAGAGAAGQGFPGSPLPDPHLEHAPVDHPHELHVRPPGEQGMMLDHGPDHGHIDHLGIPHENHRVGIAHVHAGDKPGLAHDLQPMAQHQLPGQIHRDQPGVQLRRAHIRPHPGDLPVFHRKPRLLHAALGGDGKAGFIREPPLIHIFADAADGVAAHFGFAAIGVEDAHAEIRAVGRLDEHQPIRARAEMGPAHHQRQPLRILHHFFKAIHIQVIVADALHFGKPHCSSLPFRMMLLMLCCAGEKGSIPFPARRRRLPFPLTSAPARPHR